MIPAQRSGAHDRLDTAPAYRMTITDPGSTEAGPGFRTHRATVTVTPQPAPDGQIRTWEEAPCSP